MVKIAGWTKQKTLDYLNEHNITDKTKFKELTGMSMWSIINLLNKHDIILKRKNMSIEMPTKIHIENILLQNRGSLNKTKIQLNVSYQTLYRWLKFHSITFEKKAPGGKGGINTSNTTNSKDYWQKLADKYKSKTEISQALNIGFWGPHYWLTYYNIHIDGRNEPNNKLEIPSKEELSELYKDESLLGISKYYGNVSNVTVKKWFEHHNIQMRTHKENQLMIAYPKAKITNLERYGTEHLLPPVHSKAEIELLDWLNSKGYNFKSDRTILKNNYELDGYDPNIKAAFEYTGMWWHCEKHKPDKNYHLSKYQQCTDKGIHLFTIYENEWNTRKDQIKNFLLGSLGKYEHKLYARDCTLKIFNKSDKQVSKFFDDYHIQGKPNGYETCVTLWKSGMIIGAMSFGKHHRQGNENVLVLNRLCWKTGYTVVGGAKRMFSYIPKNKTIVSWSDNRFAIGGVYERLGFALEEVSGPDYCYVNKDGIVKAKQSMQRKNIGCLPGETELQKCTELGFYRVWDCGKKKWIYNT